MKSIYIFTIIIAGILTFSSCKKGGNCEEALTINQSDIAVTFKDQATGKYLYSEINPLYNKDSLKVFDPNGNSLIVLRKLSINPGTFVEYWELGFGSIYDPQLDAAAFNSEICKNFLVKYKYNESDTIKTCFKARKTKCGSVFETLKVYYKGQLLGTSTNKTGIDIIITKN